MVNELKVGDKIPHFLLKDHENYEVSEKDILGTPVVLYFYPKDDTPGCTDEACSFRDKITKFDELQTLVIGISPDSVESHKKFVRKFKLDFSLLSDEKKEMCQAFGVLDEKKQIIRSTFVINSRSEICWIEKPVVVKDHAGRVLEALETHCKKDLIPFDAFQKDYLNFLKSGSKMSVNMAKRGPDEKQKK